MSVAATGTAAAGGSAAPTRRERQRQATYDEIVEVSRRLLRASEDVSLRAVSAEMGMTPPALYRYVDSHAELMVLVARSVFEDVVAEMAAARDRYAADDPAAQIVASASAFRRWALGNREEFRLVFAPPVGAFGAPGPMGAGGPEDCLTDQSGGAELFGGFFSEIFSRLWAKYRFAVPSDDELDPVIVEAVRAHEKLVPGIEGLGTTPSAGMAWLFERAWARLYGIVTLEVFGHINPGLAQSGALFAATMRDIGADIGLLDEWPRLQGIAAEQPA
jgi:AcrR family transcriptional regulator